MLVSRATGPPRRSTWGGLQPGAELLIWRLSPTLEGLEEAAAAALNSGLGRWLRISESLLGVGAKVRLVSVEVRILDLALERVQHVFLSNGGRRGWSRSGNRHAGRATGPAAGPASHESVGR